VRTSDTPDLELAGLADLAPPTPAPVYRPPVVGPQAAHAVEPTLDRTRQRSSDERRPTAVLPYTVR
jgi:hypothetical protein